MQYIFYLIIFFAFVYVMTGIVQSALFAATPIKRDELPSVIEAEVQQYFPKFSPQVITLQKARQRYKLQGKWAGKPGELTFGLTPERELSILEFSRASDTPGFVKLKSIASSQLPPKIASQLQPFLGSDEALMETSSASSGLIGEQSAFRISVDSRRFHYSFEITDSGELFKFSKKEVA